jgi:hypothetical protein
MFLNFDPLLCSYWEWPKIPGIKDFQGSIAHTANYPEGLDLKGKRVAVCGIGSSGIQIIAKIQKEVGRLYTWIRSPTWVLGAFGSKFINGDSPNPVCKLLLRLNRCGQY